MQQRRITLEDGRYLIFYTFEDEAAPSEASSDIESAKRVEPQAKPQAEEER
ncbi:MAG TPA: hypothetical protein VGO91_00445 [Pyrinomonadaceae bacterium]|jgi:hypothetical protein|nr:hypothetical protein [Pyrinomonadaceae bacterium]